MAAPKSNRAARRRSKREADKAADAHPTTMPVPSGGTPAIRVIHVSPEVEYTDKRGRVISRGRPANPRTGQPIFYQLNEVEFPPGLAELLLRKCGAVKADG